ncbi:MAG: hypothetical protein J6O51_07545 [Bacteroidales bacterium]|nr:hypothetical protein [Bacteroidales bacterium]
MIYSISYHADEASARASYPQADFFDLYQYIEHKIGSDIASIKSDSPDRFRVIEEEALRDLVVMSKITGRDRIIRLGPDTLSNPECARLIAH